MTRERARELLPVIEAFASGKEIQYLPAFGDAKWRDLMDSGVGPKPDFNTGAKWRIKPEPVLRAWRMEEVPVGARFKFRSWESACGMILSHTWSSTGGDFTIEFSDPGTGRINSKTNQEMLDDGDLHSTDGGKTWNRCGVLEAQ